jgi:hypothetical protein
MYNRRKGLIWTAALFIGLASTLAGCGCSSGSSTQANAVATEGSQAAAGINLILQNQPVPIFDSSAMRAEMVTIEAIQALGSPTTAFFFPPGQGPGVAGSHPFKSCPAEGEPIPNTASLDNPLQGTQITSGTAGNSSVAIDQMDPNGTYVPASSTGTYVLCDNANGSYTLTYWEGDVYDQTGTAVWDQSTLMVNTVGPDELPVCVVVHATAHDGTDLQVGTPYYHCTKAAVAAP